MKPQAPYVRATDIDHDHEDVDNEFKSDWALEIFSRVIGSLVVFVLLATAIVVMMKMPASWLTWIVLYIGGV